MALSFTKAARDDVDYVRERITEMARGHSPGGSSGSGGMPIAPVPIRSFDQVGVLTSAFNLLVARFAAAETYLLLDDTRVQITLSGKLETEAPTQLEWGIGYANAIGFYGATGRALAAAGAQSSGSSISRVSTCGGG